MYIYNVMYVHVHMCTNMYIPVRQNVPLRLTYFPPPPPPPPLLSVTSDEDDTTQSTTSSLHVPGPCFSVYELRNKLFQTLSPNAVYIYTYKNQIKSFKLPIHWVKCISSGSYVYMYIVTLCLMYIQCTVYV